MNEVVEVIDALKAIGHSVKNFTYNDGNLEVNTEFTIGGEQYAATLTATKKPVHQQG